MANPAKKPIDIVAKLDAIAAKDPVSRLSVKRRAAVRPDVSWLTKSSPLAPQGRTSNLLAQLDANPYIKKDLPAPPKPGPGVSALKNLLMPLQIIDTPRRAVISGIREIVDTMDSDPNTKVSFGDFLNQTKDFEYGFGKAFPMKGWAGRIVGLIGDVALDPLTWATLGGTIVAKGTIKASGAQLSHLIEGGVERATAEQLAKVGVTKLGEDLYQTSARKALFGVKGSGRAAAKSVIGREGREKLAAFTQQRMEWMTKTGVANFSKEEIASAYRNIALQGKQNVPEIIAKELGIKGPGVYYFGSRVKVPGSDVVGKFLERGITRTRLGVVQTRGIDALHSAITPRGVGAIEYFGEGTIKKYRVALANGSLSDEQAQLARVILNADDIRRIGFSEADFNAVQRFGPLREEIMKPENNPVRQLLDNVESGQPMIDQAARLGISDEHLALAQQFRTVMEDLHNVTDTAWQTVVPDHVLGYQKGYLPHNSTQQFVDLMDEIRTTPAMAGLLPDDGSALHIVGNFRQRGLKAGSPFFGRELTEADLTIDNLNEIVNTWLRSEGRPVFDAFDTDMKNIVPAYIRGHANMMSNVSMMNEFKKTPEFVKLVEGYFGIAPEYMLQMHMNSAKAFEGVLTAVQNLHSGLRDSLDVLKSQLEIKYGSMDAALMALKNPAVSEADVAELLGHLNTAMADAAMKHAEMVRADGVVASMLPDTDGFGVYARHAVESANLEKTFNDLSQEGLALRGAESSPAHNEAVAEFLTKFEKYTEDAAFHARSQRELMEVSAYLSPLANSSPLQTSGLYAEVVNVVRKLGVGQPVAPTKAVHSLEQIDAVVARLGETGSRDVAALSPVVESLRVHLKERFPSMAQKIDEILNDVVATAKRPAERVPTTAEVAALEKASKAAASRASVSPRLAARAAKLSDDYQIALDLVKNSITGSSDYTESLLKVRVLVAQQKTSIEIAHLREVFAYYGVDLGDSITQDVFKKNVSFISKGRDFGKYVDDGVRVEMEIADLEKISNDLASRLNESIRVRPVVQRVGKKVVEPKIPAAQAQSELNILMQSPEYSLAKSAQNRSSSLITLSELNGQNVDWTLGGRVPSPTLRAAQSLGGDIPLTIPSAKFWRNIFVQHKDVGQIVTSITDWAHTDAVLRITNPEMLARDGVDKISYERSLQYLVDYLREQDALGGVLIASFDTASANRSIIEKFWGSSGERLLLKKQEELGAIVLADGVKSATPVQIADAQKVIAGNIDVLKAEQANLAVETTQASVDAVYTPTVLDDAFSNLSIAQNELKLTSPKELAASIDSERSAFGTEVDAAINDVVDVGPEGPVDYRSLQKLRARLGYEFTGTNPDEAVSYKFQLALSDGRRFADDVDNVIVHSPFEQKSREQLLHEIETLKQMRSMGVETFEIKSDGIRQMIKVREDAVGIKRRAASSNGLPVSIKLKMKPKKIDGKNIVDPATNQVVMEVDVRPSLVGTYRRYDDGTASGRLFLRREDMTAMKPSVRFARAKQLSSTDKWVEVRYRPITPDDEVKFVSDVEKEAQGFFSYRQRPGDDASPLRWMKTVEYGDEQWARSTSEYGFTSEQANTFGGVIEAADSPDLLGVVPGLPESLTVSPPPRPMTASEEAIARLQSDLESISSTVDASNASSKKARTAARSANTKAQNLVTDLQTQFDSVKGLVEPHDPVAIKKLEDRLLEVQDMINSTQRGVAWDRRVKVNQTVRKKSKITGNYFNESRPVPSGRTTVRTRVAGTSSAARSYNQGIKTLDEGIEMLRTFGTRGPGFAHLENIAQRQIQLQAEYEAAVAVLGNTEVEQRLMTGLQNSILTMEKSGRVTNTAGQQVGQFPSSNVRKFFPDLEEGWQYLSQGVYGAGGVKGDYGIYPGLAGSPEFVALWNQAKRFDDPEYLRQMHKYVGSYTKFFKAYATMTPGFHVRNGLANAVKLVFMGAEFNNMIEATPLYIDWMKASRAGMQYEDWVLTKPLEVREVLRTARKSMFGSGGGIFTEDFKDAVGGSRLWDNKLVRFNAKWGQESDNYSRFVLGFDSAKSGMDVGMAQARTKRAFFDYEDLSQVDEIMRQIVPFWLWTSRNLIFELQNQWLNPKPYQIYNSIMRNMRDPDYETSEYPSPFVREIGGIKLPFGDNLYFAPDLGFTRTSQQLGEVFDPIRYTNNLNPLLKIPLEEFLGRSVFTGNTLDNPQERLIHILKGFVPPVQMGDRLIGSEGDAAKNAWLSFVGSPVRTYQTKEK
jgi:hypothetical protein